jgi:exosome complex component CSL4
VTRVNARQANVSILVVDGIPCTPGDWSACRFTNNAAGEDPTGADFTGVIRSQDVRMTDKDSVKLSECFRPGDIVRATVISLGDARSYFLATTANQLGVVYALPAPIAGSLDVQDSTQSPLIPLNWQEMQDPVTGTIEKRKVAKPM